MSSRFRSKNGWVSLLDPSTAAEIRGNIYSVLACPRVSALVETARLVLVGQDHFRAARGSRSGYALLQSCTDRHCFLYCRPELWWTAWFWPRRL